MAVFALILLITFSIVGQMSNVWKRSSSKIESFQGARLAFEAMTRNLSQATLNPYIDYDNAANATSYLRKSDLNFLNGQAGGAARNGTLPGTSGCGQAIFFTAPLGSTANWSSYGGMDALLSTCGYYVSFTTNSTIPPHVNLPPVYRYRLMQLIVPTETQNSVYPTSPAPTQASDWTAWFSSITWISSFVSQSVPIADNVILLVVRPEDPSNTSSPDFNPDYSYDSALNATAVPQPVTANQLPPVVQVTMVAIDEPTATRLNNGTLPPSAIRSALNGKFTSTANFTTDMTSLETALDQAHVPYRVFSSTIPVLEAQWLK